MNQNTPLHCSKSSDSFPFSRVWKHCASYSATSPTSGPHSLPLTPSDDSPLLSLLQPHRPLCFLLSIPDIFPLQGFCTGCSCCLECLFPRSHPFKSFLKRYLSEAYQTIPLKMAKLSSCTLLAPSLLHFPRHLCRICYLFFLSLLSSLFPRM